MVRQYVADLLIGCRDVCRVPGWLADGLMVMASKGNKRRGKQMNALSRNLRALPYDTERTYRAVPVLAFGIYSTLRAFLGV